MENSNINGPLPSNKISGKEAASGISSNPITELYASLKMERSASSNQEELTPPINPSPREPPAALSMANRSITVIFYLINNQMKLITFYTFLKADAIS